MQARDIQTRVAQYLSEAGPVKDLSGRATHVLKDAVGYTGDTLAFTRILATMSNKGLITRDIRGKRTYAIALSSEPGSLPSEAATRPDGAPTPVTSVRTTALVPSSSVASSTPSASTGDDDEGSGDVPSSAELDYDELAYQLLRRVSETLAAKSAGEDSNAGFLQRRLRRAESRVSELERQLARAQAENNQLREESADLQGRLDAAEQNLSVLTTQLDRRPKRAIANARDRLDAEERAVLRRLAGG